MSHCGEKGVDDIEEKRFNLNFEFNLVSVKENDF